MARRDDEAPDARDHLNEASPAPMLHMATVNSSPGVTGPEKRAFKSRARDSVRWHS